MAAPKKCLDCAEVIGCTSHVELLETKKCEGCDTVWRKVKRTIVRWEMRGEVPEDLPMGAPLTGVGGPLDAPVIIAPKKREAAPLKEESAAKRVRTATRFETVCIYDKIHKVLSMGPGEVTYERNMKDTRAFNKDNIDTVQESIRGTPFEVFAPDIPDVYKSYMKLRKKDPSYKVASGNGKSDYILIRDYSKEIPVTNWAKGTKKWTLHWARKYSPELLVYKQESIIKALESNSDGVTTDEEA